MLVATAPMLIATATAKPWNSLGQVIARAKQASEQISYGTVGVGSLAHLTMERLQAATGISMIHVPYRGGGPMSTAAMAGEIDLAVERRRPRRAGRPIPGNCEAATRRRSCTRRSPSGSVRFQAAP